MCPKYLTLPSVLVLKAVTLEAALVVMVLSEPGLVAELVEYALVIGQPEPVVVIAGPVVMALMVVVMFEPAVIDGSGGGSGDV